MFGNFFGTSYKHRVGDVVHLGDQSQFLTIGWRGYLLAGANGRRIRVPVYWLESDWGRETNWHWD
jgi:hypothetical protein